MKTVVIYSADGCKFCDEAKAVLKQRGLSYEERNVDRSEVYLQEAHELGKRWLPIIRVGDRVLVSPTSDELLQLIDSEL